jgi:hypothetical protein
MVRAAGSHTLCSIEDLKGEPKSQKPNSKWKKDALKTQPLRLESRKEDWSQKTFVVKRTASFGGTYLERMKTRKDFSPQMKE